MRAKCLLSVAYAALAAATYAPDAVGQGMQSPAQWYINQQIYSTRVFNGVIANSMLNSSQASAQARDAAQAQPPDPTRFAQGKQRLVPAKFAAREAAAGAQRAAVQASYDAHIDLYEKTAAKDGFPANDLAYAYQYFVVNSYQVYHDLVAVPLERDPYLKNAIDGFDRITLAARKRQQQVSPSQERAIYEQFRQKLGASPEVRRMTDREKQESTEMLAVTFGVTFAAYMQAINEDSGSARNAAREAARIGLEKMLGRPITQIRIGYAGLE
jgi:hypothetical protein